MPKVPTKESGTTKLGMEVDQTLRRKQKTTRMTRRIDMTRVTSTSLTEARIILVLSSVTSRRIDGGIDARSIGKSARTRSAVSMIFAWGWRNRARITPGFLFTNHALRM